MFVGGGQSIQRGPTQTTEEHANSKQKDKMMDLNAGPLADGQHC